MNAKFAGIEFLRFFFMIWICLIHIWTPFPICNGGIGVDFFFITSGYFLIKGFEKVQTSVASYAWKRFVRLFPAYITGIILGYVLLTLDLLKDGEGISFVQIIESFMAESMMIQESGWFTHLRLANPVSWYVGVLFIGSVLLYSFLRYNKKLTINVFIPVFCLGYYTLYAHSGVDDIVFFDTVVGSIFFPLARGIAGLSIGILIGELQPIISESSGYQRSILNVLSLLSLIFITLYILFIPENHNTMAVVLFTFIVAACTMAGSWLNSWFDHPVWYFLGGITYEMLMMQIPCRYLINFGYNFFPYYRGLWVLSYLLLTILAAFLLHKILLRFPRRQPQ